MAVISKPKTIGSSNHSNTINTGTPSITHVTALGVPVIGSDSHNYQVLSMAYIVRENVTFPITLDIVPDDSDLERFYAERIPAPAERHREARRG